MLNCATGFCFDKFTLAKLLLPLDQNNTEFA